MGLAKEPRPRGGKEPPMRNRAKSGGAKQTNAGWWLPVEQLTLPMIEGIARSKESLLEWVHQVGLSALRELFEHDAERIAGPKGKHSTERSHYRWGSAPAELPFGGRRIVVRRPRVRSRSGQEARLATVEHSASMRCPRECSTRFCSGSRPAAMRTALSRCRRE